MRKHEMRRWRGLKALVHDAVDATTELVFEGHESTSRAIRRVTDAIDPIREPVGVIDDVRRFGTATVMTTIRGVNRAAEWVTDLGLDAAERSLSEGDPLGVAATVPMRSDVTRRASWVGDAALGLVNAAVGDYLADVDNGLDLSMTFRIGDRYVVPDPDALSSVLTGPSPRVAVFVHGLGATEWSWCLEGEAYHGDPAACFGTLLEADLGHTPVYLRYNAGRKVSDNGRALAEQLERLVNAWPIPLEELVLVGHSIGGLVLRSACHHGIEDGRSWVGHVRRIFCLGSPHRGAPLAKLGHALGHTLGAIDLPATRITSRILESRSAAIKDLRHGTIVDADWLGVDASGMARTTPNVPGARHYFLSATVTEDGDHPFARLLGDLLVRVPSASGPELRQTHFAIETRNYGGVLHHQLQNHPAVYAQIRSACAQTD